MKNLLKKFQKKQTSKGDFVTVLFIILAAFILLTGVFFITPLQFGIEIKRTSHINIAQLYFKLFGIPVRIPIRPQTKSEDKKQKKIQRNESPVSFENFRENIFSVFSASKVPLKKKSNLLSFITFL